VALMPSYFLQRMAATTDALPRIILRRDRQLDPSSKSGGSIAGPNWRVRTLASPNG
jgi:hypothetical protein